MHISCDNADGPVIIVGLLDISSVIELRDALAGHLKRECDLILDLSGVDNCDITALQVLIAMCKSDAVLGTRARIASISKAIVDVCVAIGLPIEVLTAIPVDSSQLAIVQDAE